MNTLTLLSVLVVATATSLVVALPVDRLRRRSASSAPVLVGNTASILIAIATVAVVAPGRSWGVLAGTVAGIAAGHLLAGRIADRAWGPATPTGR